MFHWGLSGGHHVGWGFTSLGARSAQGRTPLHASIVDAFFTGRRADDGQREQRGVQIGRPSQEGFSHVAVVVKTVLDFRGRSGCPLRARDFDPWPCGNLSRSQPHTSQGSDRGLLNPGLRSRTTPE